MFDFVSKHKRILQIVLGLTIIPFAFFGLESYTRSMSGAGDVASVDGTPISQREFGEDLHPQADGKGLKSPPEKPQRGRWLARLGLKDQAEE
jgi:hypothetical protein